MDELRQITVPTLDYLRMAGDLAVLRRLARRMAGVKPGYIGHLEDERGRYPEVLCFFCGADLSGEHEAGCLWLAFRRAAEMESDE